MLGSKRRLAEAMAAVHKEIDRLDSAMMAETTARLTAEHQLAVRLDGLAEATRGGTAS